MADFALLKSPKRLLILLPPKLEISNALTGRCISSEELDIIVV